MARNYKQYIETDESLILIFEDDMVALAKEHPLFGKVKEAVGSGKFDALPGLIDMAAHIKRATHGKFWVNDAGCIVVDGEELPDALSKRLMTLVEKTLPTEPLEKFWANLKLNPSAESRKDLYGFLEHNGIPITSDGCFLCYKRVGDDFKDLNSRSFDNSVGKVVKMDRSGVNPDRNVTCSTGLHVAAWKYAHDFYFNGHLLEVKVNPRDVVSVPVDYNNEKMRCCEYVVVRIADKPREEPLVFSVGDKADYLDPDTGVTHLVTIKVALEGFPHKYEVELDDTGEVKTVLESDLSWEENDEDYEEDDEFLDDEQDEDEDEQDEGGEPEQPTPTPPDPDALKALIENAEKVAADARKLLDGRN